MKKFIFTVTVALVFLTGCGNSNHIIVEEIGEATKIYEPAVTEPTKPKRQPVLTDSPAQSRTDTATETAVTSSGSPEITYIESTADMQNETDVPESSGIAETSHTDNSTQTTSVTEPSTDAYYLDGIVYEVTDKHIVIKESQLNKTQISVSDKTMTADINVGDTVEITYNGLINEGDINYAYDAYSIEVTKKAGKAYHLEDFRSNEKGFSMLVPDGWIYKEIDYPHDNDFTDWGIRLAPANSVGSMDITWHSSITISGSFDKETVSMNGISARKYSRQGVWRFFVYENNYVATNNFFETSQHSTYSDDMELMLSTIEFL